MQAFKGRMTKTMTWSHTVCFWTDLTDDVPTFFQILNTRVIRNIIPSQPLLAKEVGVSFLHKLKPLNKTLGRVVSQLIQMRVQSQTSYTTNDMKNFPLGSKDNDGSLSYRQSLSLKKKSPLSQNLQRRLKKNGASRWL